MRRFYLWGWLLLIGMGCGSTAVPELTATTTPAYEDEMGTPGTTTFVTMSLSDGTELNYAVTLPAAFDPSQSYPILLALPPGPQNRQMVNAGLHYWEEAALQRGWIVVSPEAPSGVYFFSGSEVYIPEFLDRVAALYHPEGGKFHLAGISNGGISVFRIAGNEPQRFHSLLVLPGFARTAADRAHLAQLADVPVAMFVGEKDVDWIARMEQTAALLEEAGADVSLTIAPNEGHVISSLTGAELYDWLEQARP